MADPARTPLHDRHVAAGGRMVDFAGFEMPVQYEGGGVIAEHTAVRTAAGLFDVSHMGEVFFEGPEALRALDGLVTNDLSALEDGQALYTVICNDAGGIVDDTVIYRFGADRLMVCVNAANRAKDYAFLKGRAAGDVRVTDASDAWGQIALQGPRFAAILSPFVPGLADMRPFRFVEAKLAGAACIVATTGYTGERGVEVFCPAAATGALWDLLLEAGRPHGLRPCGLGARDSLRLEARMCLYGQDIDDTTTPIEAGLSWVVKLGKGSFVGRAALLAQKDEGVRRRLVGFEVTGRGIARHGHGILPADGGAAPIGHVTSGTMSPTLGKAIGLGYVPADLAAPGSELAIDVRGRAVPAVVVKGPFYRSD